MSRIQVGGAGGAPSNNFIRSLKESNRIDHIIGTTCIPSDLLLANVNEKYLVPPASSPDYHHQLLQTLKKSRPDFIHLQNDYEVRAVSRIRNDIKSLGVKLFLPKEDTIENCVDKQKSYEIWNKSGIKVAKTILLNNEADLKRAYNELGSKIWIRAVDGGGGRGSLPSDNYDFSKIWIDRFNGWGTFTASELLSEKTATWQSIWYEGELVVAQTRRRHSWVHGNRTLSGVTGVTGVGETYSCDTINQVSIDSILSIDPRPHGIFSVDLTYDFNNFPNPTEINIARFFTTHYFFTKAGLNFPEIYCDIGIDNKFPSLTKKINPLPDGLLWIRGMDQEPILTNTLEFENIINSCKV
jgi:hypothetical protein